MTEIEFKSLAQQGFNRIPLIAEAFADLETPLSLYLKLVRQRTPDRASCSNRWSAASASAATRSSACRRARCCAPAAFAPRSSPTAWWSRRDDGNPLDFIAEWQQRFRVALRPGLPRFCGGLAGYFGYDTVRFIEPRLAKTWKEGGIDTPDILLLQCEELAVIDNLSGRLYLIVYADPTAPEAWFRARRRLAELTDKLDTGVTAPPVKRGPALPVEREFDKADYLAAVHRAKEYVAAGDMMQVQIGAAAEEALHRVAAQPLPGAALAEPVAVHVLLRLRRLPGGRRLARDPGAPGAHAGGRQGDDPAARRNAAARRDAGAGQGARGRAASATRRSGPST